MVDSTRGSRVEVLAQTMHEAQEGAFTGEVSGAGGGGVRARARGGHRKASWPGGPDLYGGSLKPDNAEQLLGLPDVDGALIGGASLDPQSFASIIEIADRLAAASS